MWRMSPVSHENSQYWCRSHTVGENSHKTMFTAQKPVKHPLLSFVFDRFRPRALSFRCVVLHCNTPPKEREIHQRDFTLFFFFWIVCYLCSQTQPFVRSRHETGASEEPFKPVTIWKQGAFSPFPFSYHRLHSPSTEPILKHNEPIIVYLLLSSAAEGQINQWWPHTHTHTQANAHCTQSLDTDDRVFDVVSAVRVLYLYLSHHMIFLLLLTSKMKMHACAYAWRKDNKTCQSCFAFMQQTKSIRSPPAWELLDSVVWLLSRPVCLIQHE